MMFEEYKNAVLFTYEKLKEEDKLPLFLSQPTTARLRDQCLKVYDKGNLANDLFMLEAFFVFPKNGDYRKSIEKTDPDNFRPLCNFLKGETSKTDIKNIELLAWLLDFNHRPNTVFYKENKKKNISLSNKVNKPQSKVLIAMAALIFIILAGGGTAISIYNSEQCMYWTGDDYQSVACDSKKEGVTTIALDTDQLNQLKRITQPDTLSTKDLGKTWYVKITLDSPEFYTAGGYYPLDNKKWLKPMSSYILKKYILDKKQFKR